MRQLELTQRPTAPAGTAVHILLPCCKPGSALRCRVKCHKSSHFCFSTHSPLRRCLWFVPSSVSYLCSYTTGLTCYKPTHPILLTERSEMSLVFVEHPSPPGAPSNSSRVRLTTSVLFKFVFSAQP